MARVLVVDDDPDLREVLRLHLEAGGHDVTEAADGCEAIACFARGGVEAIVADVRMPRMDGLRLLAELGPHIRDRVPFILLTTFTDPSALEAAMYADAFDYLAKPFDPRHVLSVVDRALAGRLSTGGEGDRGLATRRPR